MKVRDEDLMAYHLHELSWWKRMQVRRALERDGELAAQSEEIAATLRAFCCEPAPVVSAEQMERSWQRVRGSLGVLEASRKASRAWVWMGAGAAAAVVAVVSLHTLHVEIAAPVHGQPAVLSDASWSGRLLQELHRHKAQPFNHHAGPLTTAPVDAVAEDPALAAHLDTAERVLTEVSHAEGPLQADTREQVHRLLLSNALFSQSAAGRGDRTTASVVDDLGRVLTTLDAQPVREERGRRDEDSEALRLHMNLGGVLLDLRILHHNDGVREQ